MSVISTSRATERLSRKLQAAGLNYWVGRSSGDSFGKYLRFEVGGRCVGGMGWTLREAKAKAEHLIDYKDFVESPPFEFMG